MMKPGYLFSTIGRKQIMAIAGIALSLFVLTHALGNMLIFIGPDAYNKYSYLLISNPLIYVAEAGLLLFFAGHIVAGFIVTIRNWKARDSRYAKPSSGAKATSLTTKTMMVQGLVILGFVVLHLVTFKFGTIYETTVDGTTMRDLFRLVNEVFQSLGYVIWYVLALLVLCFHLSHGLYSSLQTLGANHPQITAKIKKVSVIYGILVSILFISQPIYLHFFYKA